VKFSQSIHEQQIRELVERRCQALRDKRARGVVELYASEVCSFGLAEPLQLRGADLADPNATQAWLDTWDGPLDIELRDLTLIARGELAVAFALEHLRGTKRDGSAVAMWFRTTLVFVSEPSGEWKIAHVHDSVPFAMDGSQRARLDLKP
jgi:ketosteroid isomerase-like protein